MFAIFIQVAILISFLVYFITKKNKLFISICLSAIATVLCFIQLSIYGLRWQMIPAYLLLIALWILLIYRILKKESWVVQRRNFIMISGMFVFLVSLILTQLFPVINFPKPSGEYTVGTKNLIFEDTNRSEIFLDDGGTKRRLLVKVWYPSRISPGMKPEKYSEYYEGDPSIPGILVNYMSQLQTNSYLNASIAPAKEKFPIIIFSHGAYGNLTQNTVQMEELASHGYCVFSISHTYEAGITKFPDGKAIPVAVEKCRQLELWDSQLELANNLFAGETAGFTLQQIEQLAANRLGAAQVQLDNEAHIYQTLFPNEFKNVTNAEKSKLIIKKSQLMKEFSQLEYEPDNRKVITTRIADVEFVLDKIQALNNTNESIFYNKLNLDKVGILGHSRGGYISERVCLEDNRFTAGINLDGPPQKYLPGQVMEKPFMLMLSEKRMVKSSINLLFERLGFSEPERQTMESAQNDMVIVTVKGSAHHNFDDLNIIIPPAWKSINKIIKYYPALDLISDIDSNEMKNIENNCLVTFFNKYLKDNDFSIIDKLNCSTKINLKYQLK